MSPTGHLAFGFIAKKFAPKTPVLVLLIAAYLIDILCFCFLIIGIETADYAPWSHSLLMASVWSVLTVLITVLITGKQRLSLILGLVVFSHWLLDFLVWNDLTVAFNKTMTVGLGFYNMLGFDPSNFKFGMPMIIATLLETGLLAIGIFIYVRVRRKQKTKS